MKTRRHFTLGELLLLIMLICTYLVITVQLGSFSIAFWGLAVMMAAVLSPAHQRRQTPELLADVLSTAVIWAVACGMAGFALDIRLTDSAPGWSWAVVGQLMGFYLGLLWVLVVLLVRHVERVAGRVDRPRPIL